MIHRFLRFHIFWQASLCVLLATSAHATQFLRITKSNAVIGYKDPTTQSKMITVFAKGDEVEISGDNGAWFRVKIAFSQGYFLYGWVQKNASSMVLVTRQTGTAAAPATTMTDKAEEPEEKSSNQGSSESFERERSESARSVAFFTGPVYSLYKFGAFQYRFGFSYQIPVSHTIHMGFPVSYQIGDGFNIFQLGLNGMYSFYVGPFAIIPYAGAGYEYLYGNGSSFHAAAIEGGGIVEYSLTNWLVLGVEPFGVRAMVWNSTSSFDKVPFNIRGESLITLRGHW